MRVFLQCMLFLALPFAAFLVPIDVVAIRLLGAEVGPFGTTRQDLDDTRHELGYPSER